MDAEQVLIYKHRLEAIMDSLNEGVVIFDADFKVIDVNKAFNNLFRIKEENLRSKEDSQFYKIMEGYFDGENLEKFRGVTGLVTKSKKLIGDTFEMKSIKPWELFFRVFTAPIFDNNDGFVGRVWKFQNITEEKLVDNMKTEFISIASHQLRTPITTINGYLEMLDAGDFGEVDDSMRDAIHDMKQASINMINLVNGLLDVSKLELGNIEPEIEEFDISRLVMEVVGQFDPQADAEGISLTVDRPDELKIESDKKLITEAIKNYLSNAIKYTPKDGIVIVTVSEVQPDNVKINIEDNGIGIPGNQLDGLFKKFFRADNVMTENFEGTGLGLYYVHKAIKALGGEVGYFPGEINGSNFWFSIPKKNS